MTELPTSARSWDITRMTRAEQLQASRSLMQSNMAAATRHAAFFDPPMARPGPNRAAAASAAPAISRPQPPAQVFAGTPLPLAPLESVGPPPAGTAPAGLAPAGTQQAPLLGTDRPLDGVPDQGDPSPTPSAVEGQRARTTVGMRHGVDLTDVRVDRSRPAASEAAQLRARAFTSDRGIVIPPAAGSLDFGPGEALLSHELTHVAQRVRFGGDLPSESSPAGRVLEGEALDTEMTLRGEVPSGSNQVPPRSDAGNRSWAGVLGGRAANPDQGQPLPLASGSSNGLDPDSLATSILERLSGISMPGLASGPAAEVTGFVAPSAPLAPAMAAPAMAGGIQRAEEVVPDFRAGVATAALPGGGQSDPLHRPSDQDLSNLSRWLYPLIKYRLKGELREDRERAGLLTDHYRKW
jgi:hypothetical protein